MAFHGFLRDNMTLKALYIGGIWLCIRASDASLSCDVFAEVIMK